MGRNRRKIYTLILISALLFLAMPVVSAHINITDVGTGYDMEEHYGYVDYQNIANYNVSGAILIFIDGDIVAGKMLDMPIRYVVGFRCSPIKTLEFSLSEAEGDHTIVVHILSMNNSVQRAYEYYAEDWWGQEPEDVEESEEVKEDWLKCWKCDD